MKARMSALVKYLLYLAGDDVKTEFINQVRDHHRGYHSNNQYVSRGNLSDVIHKFKEGEKTDLAVKSEHLKEYFKWRGPHFCAGYLSQFGEVVTDSGAGSIGISQSTSYVLAKIIHNKPYKAALNVWSEYKKQKTR